MENLTLVIPAKFEATTLPVVLKEIKDLNLSCKKIVVVPKYDEETQKALEGTDCHVLIQKGEGFGNALIEGLRHSSTEYSCIFNADGSFDPKYLKEMLNKNMDNNEFIFSTRYKKPGGSDDDTILTFFGNYFFTLLCKILFRLTISDVLYTYVMGKTSAFKNLNLICNDFSFCVELPIKAKFRSFRVFDFPSYERPRISGKKKVNELRDGFLILISILKLFIFKK